MEQKFNTFLQLADLYTTAKSLGTALGPHLQPATLAEMPGESAAERQARIQKAAQGATDISGLVKSRKNQKPAMAAVAEDGAPAANGNGVNGKRKLEDEDDVVSEKKVRFGE
jgi:hypothetical protein